MRYSKRQIIRFFIFAVAVVGTLIRFWDTLQLLRIEFNT